MTSRSLTRRVFPFTIEVDAGTSRGLPLTTSLAIPNTILRTLELTVPTGHVGLTGIAFDYNDQQLLPWPGGEDWIIAEGQEFVYDLNIEVDQSVGVRAYNAGLYLHNFYVRMTLDDIVLPGQGASVGVNVLAL